MKEDTQERRKVIQIDEGAVRDQLSELVRGSVEETLNTMLDAEADRLTNAKRYERTEGRKDTRAGYYERKLQTKAGEVSLKVPKLRQMKFETAIIERYRRRESSVEEALVEMYLAGVSVRRVEDITEALWGTRVSPSTVSELNKKVYEKIEAWRSRPIDGKYPYVYLDGLFLKQSWGGEVHNIAVLIAVGVADDGYREVLGVCEGAKEDKASWLGFLRHLKERGLTGVQLIISDACSGLVEALGEAFGEAQWQRCTVHFYRNIFARVPAGRVATVAAMLKAIHAQESRQEAMRKAKTVIEHLREMKLGKAAEVLEQGIPDTLTYYDYPPEHWRRVRTNNPIERVIREVRRRTQVVGCFPDGHSALMLVSARLRHVAGTKWGTRKYLDMSRLRDTELTEIAVA
jgi:putative transposase